jgi:alpha-glucoside transport system substrate-binding protein
MRRRTALAVFALAGAAGCGAGGERLRVVAVWNGWELTRFHDILNAFARRNGTRVSLLSAGNDLDALLGNRVAETSAPDVALVDQPRLVHTYRRWLMPPPTPSPPPGWAAPLTVGGRVYGSWFKVAHKSIVWYRPDLLRTAPATWDEWVAVCRDLAARGRPPLAVGAADGWVLTDWFENALLSIDPTTYQRLVGGAALWRHDSVKYALRRVADMWSIPGAFPGGPRRALLTQFDGALVDVFEHGSAVMAPGADFYYPIIRQYGSAPARWFPFPHRPGEKRPLLVAGDAAVLLRPGRRAAKDLIGWLSSSEAVTPWAHAGGLLSLDREVKGYPADLWRLADELQKDTDVTFDLSDQLQGGLAGNDGRGTWRIFQEFFAAVAERPSAVESAVSATATALERASRRSS